MDYIIIIQARLSSSRIPNKVLSTIHGEPLLNYLIQRLFTHFDKSKLMIATSNREEDNMIEDYCEKNGLFFFRGSLNDVAGRMLKAAKLKKAKAFIRINGDSPLIDPLILKKAIILYKSGTFDLITNVFPRSYPIGQSIEIINTNTFEKVYTMMSKPEHFEHVTKYYYEYSDNFRIQNFTNDQDLSKYRLVIDTPEDLIRVEKIIGSMSKAHTEYSLNELIELYPSA